MNETKECNKCRVSKPLTDFPKRGGGRPWFLCKSCKRDYDRDYWEKTKEKRKANRRQTSSAIRQRNLAYVVDYLERNPCVDCGEDDFVVLQFDHRSRADKYRDVSDMVKNRFSTKKIQEEIDKCDVRCANCHIRKTAKDFGWYKNIQRGVA